MAAAHTPATDGAITVTPEAPQIPPSSRTMLDKATDFLCDNNRLGSDFTRYLKYRRYVVLNRQQLYYSLVNLYKTVFLTQWSRLRRFVEAYPPPVGVSHAEYAAKVYISCWFHDLYVSNREAVNKLSLLAFNEHYQHEEVQYLQQYDNFLVLLNAAIRPTHIKGLPEDGLYIPLITNVRINWKQDNPFAINDYIINTDLALGLEMLMLESKKFNMANLVTDTLGRPSWLFDWHEDKCCAWFPAEGNYTMSDVTIAYIIGDACTPKLGLRDNDAWQIFPNGTMPANVDISSLKRKDNRQFYGAFEIRTFEVKTFEIQIHQMSATLSDPVAKKRKQSEGLFIFEYTTEASTSRTGTTPEETTAGKEVAAPTAVATVADHYRIVDWLYYRRVIVNIEPHTRTGALKMIVLA